MDVPGYSGNMTTPTVFFDFTTLDEDLVEYRISLISNATMNCTFSFGIDGGGISATVLPTCALDAVPIACGRTEELMLTPQNHPDLPMVDYIIPGGVLHPNRLYRLRVRVLDTNDVGCFSACIAARVLPPEPPNTRCDRALFVGRDAPTKRPSASPTQSPTASPTTYPSVAPSPAPAPPTFTDSPTRQPTFRPVQPEICNDGIDNDGDGILDCNDQDCCPNEYCCGFAGCPTCPPTRLPTIQPTRFPSPSPTIDLLTSTENCGISGHNCRDNLKANSETFCEDGQCIYECSVDYKDCNGNFDSDGCETNTNTNSNHCSVCGNVCTSGVCTSGTCFVNPLSTLQCPAVGSCTSSDGDAYSFCSDVEEGCPAGSILDANITEGSACHPNDPLQETCQCCTRDCGSQWLTSPCVQASGGTKTCTASGTCASRFGGTVDGSLSCGLGSSCECCDVQLPTPPTKKKRAAVTQCGGAVGVADRAYEPCDGSDLRGETCLTLGFAGGTLACDSNCRTFDASGCIPYGACCTNSGATCVQNATAATCSGHFVSNAIVCTPHLCESSFATSLKPQNAQQSGIGVIELGTRTTSTRQAESLGGVCTGACYVGTVGALLRSISNGTLYLLGNAHVWASPSGFDKNGVGCAESIPPRRNQDTIYQGSCNLNYALPMGRLAAFTELSPNSVQRLDVALAQVTANTSFSSAIQMGLGEQEGGAPVDPHLNMIVVKSSRSSGVTLGQVVGIDLSANVLYDSEDGSGSSYLIRYEKQFLVRGISPTSAFSIAGDSGACVFEYGTMRAVGVNFAGNSVTKEGLVSPMKEVMNLFFPGGDGEMVGRSKRKRDLPQHPMNSFIPTSSELTISPSSIIVNSVQLAQESMAQPDSVIDLYMKNNTIVAHYVGIDQDDPNSAVIVVLINEANRDDQTVIDSIPATIDGVRVVTQYTDVMKAV